jgi:hypothetical protein
MLSLALLATLLAQEPPSPFPTAPDTVPGAFDGAATRELVHRVIDASGEVPADLIDFQARVRSTLQLSLAPDSAIGGEIPITSDDLVSDIGWRRPDVLHQWVREHHTRMLVPAPYSLGSLLEQPWVIPHLYGPTIEVLSLSPEGGTRRGGRPRAIHPFGSRGPELYRYETHDTLRLRVQGELVTLVGLTVRPRVETGNGAPLVVGTFYIDLDRAAVARARFGFVEPRRGLALGRAGVFMELENGLWNGRFWLPYRQRREVQIGSTVFGGVLGARIVNTLVDYRINTGWEPRDPGEIRLFRIAAPPLEPGEPAPLIPSPDELAGFDVADFADLRRLAIDATASDPGAVRFGLRYERSDHLFRFNRVEGAYFGVAGRLEPSDPLDRGWELYGTTGWATAEGTARGELVGRLHLDAPRTPPRGIERGLSAAAYRRLRDTRTFGPTFQWDLLYTLAASLGGSDPRDYYDVTGGELSVSAGREPWRAAVALRAETHRAVERNVGRFAFGEADDFPTLAPIQEGTHAGLELVGSYRWGPGAFGIGNSLIATARAEIGFGDFQTQRVVGLLSFRRYLEPFTLAARLDAGHIFGSPPPQMLFRFGGDEGLTAYGRNEFGGSSAAIARGRLLVGVPPRTTRALARAGPFMLPALRPALVFVGETGWSSVANRARDTFDLLGTGTTDGARTTVGAGISLFDDAITLEWVRPLEEDREGRWYFGLVRWH